MKKGVAKQYKRRLKKKVAFITPPHQNNYLKTTSFATFWIRIEATSNLSIG